MTLASTPTVKAIAVAYTICPRSSDSFFIVSYYIKWVTTSWSHISASSVKVAQFYGHFNEKEKYNSNLNEEY